MATPIAEFGEDPTTGEPILLKHGRFGPYLTDGETNASIGRKRDPNEITREIAIEMLIKKREQNAKKGKGAKKKPSAKKKTPAKKKSSKKKSS